MEKSKRLGELLLHDCLDAGIDRQGDWLAAHGVPVQFRASLEQDIAAVDEYRPDLAIGTTPVVQHAKQAGDDGFGL